ncbi:MAG: glycosyltransferase [Bacteroidales bacterium]|nr:glycosyltransferase [Bacteroidales bacterium]
MKISIITATFNCESTIEKALLSVAEQTYSNIEHIIIDGASSDNTISIVEKFHHVSKIISEKDEGIYFALNKGILMAEGDVIGFLHADDFFAENNVISEIVEKFSFADAVYGDLDYVSSGDNLKIVRHWVAGIFSENKLKKGWMPPHPTFFAKKSLYEENGLFDTNFKISADYDLMLRFLCKNISVVYLPKVLVKMRVGGVSNKSLKNILLKSKEDFKAIRKNKIGGVFTLLNKNISKLSQFWKK